MPKQTEVTSDDVLKFWLDACSPADWYKADDAFDSQIRDRFEGAWQNLCDGHYSLWLTHPSGALAYIILADQFPRNMFRGQAKAFASDGRQGVGHAHRPARAAVFLYADDAF